MRFFKDFVNEVDGNTGKQHFDNTCNVRRRKKNYLFKTIKILSIM